MRYTIWHLDTGNLIGDFATESAAMAAVRDEIHANASPDALVLQRLQRVAQDFAQQHQADQKLNPKELGGYTLVSGVGGT